MSNDNKKNAGGPIDVPLTVANLEDIIKGIVDGLKAGMTEAAIATEMTRASLANAANAAEAKAREQMRTVCPECRQPSLACGQKHKLMAIYPANPRFGRWFQGVRINGVLYLSNSQVHLLTVPAAVNFENAISEWERNEEETLFGRQVDHDSGALGAGGGQFNPAHQAFR